MDYILKDNVPISLEKIQSFIKDKYGFELKKYDIKAFVNRKLYEIESETGKIDIMHGE